MLIELIVPTITTPIFALHPVILLNNTEAVLRFGGYPPFPFQMGFAHVNKELISIVGIVADHQIAVGIKAGSAAAEGLCPVGIRENIVAVPVSLDDS